MNLQELSDITGLNQPLREQIAVAIEQPAIYVCVSVLQLEPASARSLPLLSLPLLHPECCRDLRNGVRWNAPRGRDGRR
jgi:hypothetical protein